MDTVVFGFYGTTLDAGRGDRRWERWRPTISLCQQEDLLVDRYELLHGRAHSKAARVIAEDVAMVAPETEVVCREVGLEDPWDFEEVFAALHELSQRYPFAPERERYLVHITTGTHVMQICWFLLTESRHFPASLVQVSPPKPRDRGRDPGAHHIIDLDRSRYDRLARRFADERAKGLAFLKSGIDTRNPAFNRLIDSLEQVALRSQEPILLTGPTGAGKTQLARQIDALLRSRRQLHGPLVEVNCATLRGDGAMSALFGHVKGAFTGAASDRKGLLFTADGGLLFLDEIGELGLDEQAMLLRAIEEKRFLPVGTDRERSSDFRLLAGTNRDLRRAVAEGRFREDLLARINLWTFALPGLAERPEDIEPNLDHELTRLPGRVGFHVTMNRDARERFLAFATAPSATWNANFRDFGAAISRMATLAPGGRIDVPTVEDEIARLRRGWTSGPASTDDGLHALLGEAVFALDPFDRVQLAEVVRVCRRSDSLSDAGRHLFAASRQKRRSVNDADRLRKYLARHALTFDQLH